MDNADETSQNDAIKPLFLIIYQEGVPNRVSVTQR